MSPKKKPYSKFLFLSLFILVIPGNVFSQSSKNQLEKKKDHLLKSIEYADFLIDEAHEQKDITLNELILLQLKIDIRNELISNYQYEHNLYVDTIFEKLLHVNELSSELFELRHEYAMMIVGAHKNQNIYQRMLYVLAANDINQAYQRMNYYKMYAGKRNNQILLIQKSETEYINEVEKIEEKLVQNNAVLDVLKLEYARLETEIEAKVKMVDGLNKKLNQLIAEQKRNKERTLELESRITDIVVDENLNNHSDEYNPDIVNICTPEEIILSSGFTENRGKLPWPLEKGIISSSFGEHNHPELESIRIKNNGIDILTHQGAIARSVFNGKVTRVLSVPNFNNVVIVRHGDFLTVYSNLTSVFVELGSKVKTKQEIGLIYTDEESIKTELHFEIWQGKRLLDPIEWITSIDESEYFQQNTP